MRDEGLIAEEDLNIFKMVDSAEDAWRYILRWHEKNGTPLLHRGESDGME
jgi:predicted Rossmann-fold nucleotide-binding protein